jgi:hypothetical protein
MADVADFPPWVAAEVSRWLRECRSGTLTLVFRHGQIRHLKRDDLVFAPAPERASGHACPACGEAMAARDYGNLWECRCGVKRTRAQIQRAAQGRNLS